MAKQGRPPKGDRDAILLRLDRKLLQEIKVHCTAKDIEVNDTLAGVIGDWWQKQEKDRADVQELIAKKKVS